jgi:hypothetical protein
MRASVGIKVASLRQDMQFLWLQGPRVCLQREIGGGQDIIRGYNHQQRGRGDMFDVMGRNVGSERFDAVGEDQSPSVQCVRLVKETIPLDCDLILPFAFLAPGGEELVRVRRGQGRWLQWIFINVRNHDGIFPSGTTKAVSGISSAP